MRERKQITQLVPSLEWKTIYAEHLQENHESTFVEDTLKDQLRDTLKEIKTDTSNEPNSDVATLQSNEVMTQLKLFDGHANMNVLKRMQSLIEMCSPSNFVPKTIAGAEIVDKTFTIKNTRSCLITHLHDRETFDEGINVSKD